MNSQVILRIVDSTNQLTLEKLKTHKPQHEAKRSEMNLVCSSVSYRLKRNSIVVEFGSDREKLNIGNYRENVILIGTQNFFFNEHNIK